MIYVYNADNHFFPIFFFSVYPCSLCLIVLYYLHTLLAILNWWSNLYFFIFGVHSLNLSSTILHNIMQTPEADFANFSTGLYSGYELVEFWFFLKSESAAISMYPAVILIKSSSDLHSLILHLARFKVI